MVASLRLDLKDNLSKGLENFKAVFKSLRDLGRSLSLGKLGEGGAASALHNLSKEARGLAGNLKAIVTNSDAAHAALSRVKSWGSNTFGPQSRIGAFGAAAEGYSLVAPIQRYAEIEDIARRASITKGLDGAAATAETDRLMAFFRKDARDTGQSSVSVSDAYLDLIQNNIGGKLAESLLPIHSLAATAYNIDPRELGNVVQALVNSFKIDEHGMGGALASMALASQNGKFGVADFSRFLPMIGGQMSLMGMTGRSSADTAFAALETVTKNSTDPAAAATNFYDSLRYILSPMAARAFEMKGKMVPPEVRQQMQQSQGLFGAAGIDLPTLLTTAEKQGINPLDAIVAKLKTLAQGKTPVQVGELFGALLHNQMAGIGLSSLVQNYDQFVALRNKLGTADEGKLKRDAQTRMDGAAVQAKMFGEEFEQLEQTLGRGFFPVLSFVNKGLLWVVSALDRLDAKMPGVENGALLVVGSFLALGAALGAIGVVAPAVIAGFDLVIGIFSPLVSGLKMAWTGLGFVADGLAALLGISVGAVVVIAAIAAVLVAAAVDIYDNWDRFAGFFEEMWQGVKDVFHGFIEFLFGVFNLDFGRALAGWTELMSGVGEIFGGAIGIVKQLFVDLWNTLDSWTGGAVVAACHAIRDAIGSVIDKIHEWIELLKNGAVGKFLGLSDGKPAEPGAPGAADAGGSGSLGYGAFDPTGMSYLMPPAGKATVLVGIDPSNGQIMITKAASNGAVQVAAPNINAGQTLGRD
jgi:TP901 family phage tail tape measure protein